MTIENAKAFYQRMSEDSDFRTPFEEAFSKEERQQLIKDAGYDFTTDEWQAAVAEIQAADSDEELKEEELEAIAGGVQAVAMYGVIWPPDDVDIFDWFK
jgi:predicted ribosomally synthesized peptide with nif11-like leader